jgi:NAD(P)-dependent dehydrogenase (short-subunit alcohol dehydrogenase family)
MDLRGKRAVVTGGGRGIGRAVARALAEAGAAVLVSARSRGEIEATAAALVGEGYDAGAAVCDVTDPESVRRLAATAEERMGGVDILVANAGVASSAPLKAVTLEEWSRVFAVNVTGTFLVTQAFLPGMLERGWGRLVMIASTAGKHGAPYLSAYAASKHAVVGFMRSVAAEVAEKGVTANAVCPGFVETSIASEAIENIVHKTRLSAEEARATLARTSPQKRIFEADEVAFQVLALCDPRARGMNGQSIVLDGGGFQA